MEVDIDLSTLEITHDEMDGSKSSDLEDKVVEADQVRRSGRTKIRPLQAVEKRRVVTRPRKLNVNCTIKEIETYYLDKKIKVFSPALETIFEEPKKDVFMGARKLRRCLNLTSEKPDKSKVKKRSMKAKKVNKVKKLGKKIELEFLINKLKDLDDDVEC